MGRQGRAARKRSSFLPGQRCRPVARCVSLRGLVSAVLPVWIAIAGCFCRTEAAASATEEWSTPPGFRVEVDATGFSYPVTIAFAPRPGGTPQAPLYYLAELTGRILAVTRERAVHVYADKLLNFGSSFGPGGDGEVEGIGLVGLCVDSVGGDLFATTVFDDGGIYRNKIIRFRSTDDGLAAASAQDILVMSREEMRGNAHQIQHCSVGPDRRLYVAVGNGDQPRLGSRLTSLQGKILRLNLDGSPASDNPFFDPRDRGAARNYVFSLGLRNPFAMIWRGSQLFASENGVNVDRLIKVTRGMDFGYDGLDHTIRMNALFVWGPPSPVPVGMAVVDDSGFPADKRGQAFVALMGSSNEWHLPGPVKTGREIHEFTVDADGRMLRPPRPFAKYVGRRATTVVALASGPDGLYLGEFPLRRGVAASVLKIRYDGSEARTNELRRGAPGGSTVYERYDCGSCHTIGVSGGRKGPDLTDAVDNLKERLQSAEYVRMVEDLSRSRPERAARLANLLEKRGDDRVRLWLKAHIVDPKFDNPKAQMPAFEMSEPELDSLVEFLMKRKRPGFVSATVKAAVARWTMLSRPIQVLAVFGFGGMMFIFGVISAVAVGRLQIRKRRVGT
jgi:glucose/arabinose dehydrogenase